MATKFAKLPGLLRRKDWGRKTGRSVTANLANRSASEDEDRAMDYTPKNMDAVWTSLGAREESAPNGQQADRATVTAGTLVQKDQRAGRRVVAGHEARRIGGAAAARKPPRLGTRAELA